MELDFRQSKQEDESSQIEAWCLNPQVLENIPAADAREVSWWVDYLFSFVPYNAAISVYNSANELLGFAAIQLLPYQKLKHHAPITLIVNPSYWHQGVGTKLLERLEQRAQRRFNIEVISIEACGQNSLFNFCIKNGFKEFSRFENWHLLDGVSAPKICLEKQL